MNLGVIPRLMPPDSRYHWYHPRITCLIPTNYFFYYYLITGITFSGVAGKVSERAEPQKRSRERTKVKRQTVRVGLIAVPLSHSPRRSPNLRSASVLDVVMFSFSNRMGKEFSPIYREAR